MKHLIFSVLCLVGSTTTTLAQENIDSTDVFFRHLRLNEVVVTGVTGETRLAHSTMPITIVSAQDLRTTPSVNIIDAIARQPGMAQITTGAGISKPVIRGLGFNRVITMSEGVRQEGQQWGDEHGIEIDANTASSVEIIKGPASLMYGSDAMAGVLIMHSAPLPADGDMRADVATEYHTNNGLFAYTLNVAANRGGWVWDARYSDKQAHAYKNKYDGYVNGSQFRERAGRLMLGVNRYWGHSHLIWSTIHQTPSIITGERDEATGMLMKNNEVSTKSYRPALPFQEIKHYKAVWDNSLNLKNGWLKAVIGYQQNRRQEYEDSRDEFEQYFRLHTVTYDLRYLTQEFQGWKAALGLGGMWQKSENKAEEALIPEYNLFDIGAYATASKTLGKVTVNGGMRYDHRSLSFKSREFNSMAGSLGAVWNINGNLNMRLNLARGYRAPNISELGSDGVHEGTVRYELGNAELKPEHSLQLDFGADFTSRLFSAQIALFANSIDNYIFSKRVNTVMEEGLLTYQYAQGDASLMGFEAGIDFHPTHHIHFENTFSMVDARLRHQPEESKYLPLTPAPRWTSELKYEITHRGSKPFNNAFAAVSIDYNFKQNHFYRLDDTETATPAYMLLNLSAGTDILLKGRKVAQLFVTAENLLDKAYQNHLSRLKYTDLNSVTGRQGVYAMGRNVVMKIIFPITF